MGYHSEQNFNDENHNGKLKLLIQAIKQAVVIDKGKLELILAAMLARGHVLIEDVPGIGKTLVAKALALSVEASFKRVQCTPDLLPSDITGGAIYEQRRQRFEFMPGPIFANVVLVDEINRASPRTQSSLLESMAEGQVSVEGFSHQLPEPFFLIATQNPIEMAGTFPLPEAQLDRFLIAVDLGYPEFAREVVILEREEHEDPLDSLTPVIRLEEIQIQEYIVRLNQATRSHPDTVLGVSPRGGVALQRCTQALAFIRGRNYVIPDDIKDAVRAVYLHRLLPRDRRPETAKQVVEDVLGEVPVPVD